MVNPNNREQQAERLWHIFSAAIMRALLSYEADPQLREDLAHEVFIAMSQSLDRIQAAANIKAYVFRIVHNIAVDHIAKTLRRKTELYAPDDLAELQSNPENSKTQCPTENLVQQQKQHALLHAVRALKPPTGR